MTTMKNLEGEIVRELGDGLVMRRGSKRDADQLVKFLQQAFANPDTGEPDTFIGGWIRDLIGPRRGVRVQHPTFRSSDFLIVEEAHSHTIVSCCCLISQMWSYDGIPFGVG